jgi:hypothetical protein
MLTILLSRTSAIPLIPARRCQDSAGLANVHNSSPDCILASLWKFAIVSPRFSLCAGYQRIDPQANACGSTDPSLTAFRERTVIGATMVRTIVYVAGVDVVRHAHEGSEAEKECGDGCGFERELPSHEVSPAVRAATPVKIELSRRKGIAET